MIGSEVVVTPYDFIVTQLAKESPDFHVIQKLIIVLCLFFDPEDGGDMFLEKPVDFQRTTRHYISWYLFSFISHYSRNIFRYSLQNIIVMHCL
jgi:hypothetical protein